MAAGAGTTGTDGGKLAGAHAVDLDDEVLVIMVAEETGVFPRQDKGALVHAAGDLEGDHVIQVKEILVGLGAVHIAHAAKSKEDAKPERILGLIAIQNGRDRRFVRIGITETLDVGDTAD